MPNAADGSVYTDEAKLYYSATLGGAGALTEIPVVIEDNRNSERRSAESNCRGDGEISEHVGKPKHSISGSMLLKRNTPGATYLAMRAAFAAKTPHHYAMSTGAIANIGEQVFEMQGLIKTFNESRSDNDTIKVEFEIVRDPSATFASEFTTVTE